MYTLVFSIITAFIFIGGIIVYLHGRYNKSQTSETQLRNKRIRWLGISMIIISIIMGIGIYYLTVQVAQMPGDCQLCHDYSVRHEKLRPYSVNEYSTLKKQAKACTSCSEMCVDMYNLLKKDPTATNAEKYNQLNKCSKRLDYAELAKKELKRLEKQMIDSRTRAWQTAGGAARSSIVFPQIPR